MHPHLFAALTPDAVLDALDSIGLRSDGRLLALNSYENRVYQTGMEDGPPLVAKFYHPARLNRSGHDYSDGYPRLSARWGGWCKMLPLAIRLVP